MPDPVNDRDDGSSSAVHTFAQQQQFSPSVHSPASRRMSRLKAEAVIATAYRIPNLDNSSSSPDLPSSGSSNGTMDTSGRPRLTRVPSRVQTSLASTTRECYLQQSGVQFFMEDLTKKLQEHRPEQPGVFIANYFSSVMKGVHVSGRDFEFINGTMQNRIAFLTQIHKAYANVDMHMQMTLDDFTELISCQCRDFPTQLLQQTVHHLKAGHDGQVRTTLHSFSSAFSACFFYNEFLTRAYDIYGEMQASKDDHVTSPRGSIRSESIANAMAADRVVARLRVVAQQNTFVVSERFRFSIPPMLEIESFVYKSGSFKEFCARFYESPVIAGSICDLQCAFQTLSRGAK